MSKDSTVGTRVGNYQIIRSLGEGAMGTVYLAEHPDIGRKVALKALALHLSQMPGAVERFRGEARVLTGIDHPNIVGVFDFGRLDDGRLYFIMEYLRGSDLAEVMARKPRFTAEEALPYVLQICAGLRAAHQQKIVHRDLKPENIFVIEGTPPKVKIIDFGIAKVLDPQATHDGGRTRTGMVLGTPLFISPEQAAGDIRQVSPRSDIYSLGVILFAMLAGRPPFNDNIPALVMANHISGDPPSLADLAPATPQPVVEVVARCLAKLPDDRPHSAREVLDAFRLGCRLGPAEVADTVVSSPPPRATETHEAEPSPHKTPAAAAETILLTQDQQAATSGDESTRVTGQVRPAADPAVTTTGPPSPPAAVAATDAEDGPALVQSFAMASPEPLETTSDSAKTAIFSGGGTQPAAGQDGPVSPEQNAGGVGPDTIAPGGGATVDLDNTAEPARPEPVRNDPPSTVESPDANEDRGTNRHRRPALTTMPVDDDEPPLTRRKGLVMALVLQALVGVIVLVVLLSRSDDPQTLDNDPVPITTPPATEPLTPAADSRATTPDAGIADQRRRPGRPIQPTTAPPTTGPTSSPDSGARPVRPPTTPTKNLRPDGKQGNRPHIGEGTMEF